MKIEDLFSVQGKVAVVTGGSRGIGKMIASHLVQNGCKVYIASHPVDEQENIVTSHEIGCEPGVIVDVTNMDSIKKLVNHISEKEEHVDILVNNAGVLNALPDENGVISMKVEDITEEAYDFNHNVNQKSILFVTQQFIPLLSGGAAVINLSSIVGLHQTSLHPRQRVDYVANKAGQNKLTAILAQQLSSKKITVNGIAPGPVETGMLGENGINYDRDIYINKTNPSGRFAEPEDLGAAVIYLSSKAGTHMTGQILVLDGGLSQSSTHTTEWLIY
jgi:NAD(P)-dependent dehydrogenase (short-subunit alcohol dehydrogenase family)